MIYITIISVFCVYVQLDIIMKLCYNKLKKFDYFFQALDETRSQLEKIHRNALEVRHFFLVNRQSLQFW